MNKDLIKQRFLIIDHTLPKAELLAENNHDQFLLYRCINNAQPSDNITDLGVEHFKKRYGINEPYSPVCYAGSAELRDEFKTELSHNNSITKEAVFCYVYAILHHPAYRRKYESNIKGACPQIPLYDNFFQWSYWGKQLMDLHIRYESIAPYPLIQHQYNTSADTTAQPEKFTYTKVSAGLYTPQPVLKENSKADVANGIIKIDELTFLSGVPATAWNYKIEDESALTWMLYQYKEQKLIEPTIEDSNIDLAKYKDYIIDLLKRVCTVSVETMKIIEEMPY